MPELDIRHPLVALINEAVEATGENDFRDHLGGSMIGRKCDREIWYGFRHARKPTFDGRMLRLFGRGHLEEPRFVGYLKLIGCEVREFAQQLWWNPITDMYEAHDWDLNLLQDPLPGLRYEPVTEHAYHVSRAAERGLKLKQWRILDVDGHFGGSLDGIVSRVPGYDDLELLAEFKTHGDKSFKKLLEEWEIAPEKRPSGQREAVKHAKPEHYTQMQVYMHKKGLKGALYIAVNKNDEHLHIEFVPYFEQAAHAALGRAINIIHRRQPPDRIAERASFWDCKFCDYKSICHFGEPMLKGCRTCRFSVPVDDGKWHCEKWNAIIPRDAIAKGCDAYLTITD